jgi:hypothetical protein
LILKNIIFSFKGQDPLSLIILAAAGGLVVGILTILGQAVLPGNWNTLVNSGAIWLLATFFMGSRLSANTWAALAGFVILAGAVIGYFVAAKLLFGIDINLGALVFWGDIALAGGPLFGLAGRLWSNERRPLRVAAIALPGSVFAAEGLFYLLFIPEQKTASGWVMVALGIHLPLIIGRSPKDRRLALLILPFTISMGLAAYWLINAHIF